jgi:hypothetical protein
MVENLRQLLVWMVGEIERPEDAKRALVYIKDTPGISKGRIGWGEFEELHGQPDHKITTQNFEATRKTILGISHHS